jgi:hypothetical protein
VAAWTDPDCFAGGDLGDLFQLCAMRFLPFFHIISVLQEDFIRRGENLREVKRHPDVHKVRRGGVLSRRSEEKLKILWLYKVRV